MKRLLLGVAILLSGCASSSTVPATKPPASEACREAVDYLASFASRMSAQLADLRPQILARAFDTERVSDAIVEINGLAFAFDVLRKKVVSCPETAPLASRVEDLRLRVMDLANPVFTAGHGDPSAMRAAAVALFGLLPASSALASECQLIADGLGIEKRIAMVDSFASKPIGSVPPLPSPKAAPPRVPAAKPTPRATPRPTTSGSGSGTTSGGWQVGANAYLKVVSSTYTLVVSNALKLYGIGFPPGLTPEETAARQEEAALYWKPAVRALKNQLAYMAAHPARKCYADAYSADRSLANVWLSLLQSGVYPDDSYSEGRGATRSYDAAISQTRKVLEGIGSKFADCS